MPDYRPPRLAGPPRARLKGGLRAAAMRKMIQRRNPSFVAPVTNWPVNSPNSAETKAFDNVQDYSEHKRWGK